MAVTKNLFGKDYADIIEENAALRVGERIRRVRVARGLSQGELGACVGLSADRIQKYENGARKPKRDLLKQIASALEVEAIAFMDPVVSSYVGAMYAFFEMEELYDLKITVNAGAVSLSFGDGLTGSMNDYLKEWHKTIVRRDRDLEEASSEEEASTILQEYNNWEWRFPKPLAENTSKALRKMRLQDKIEELRKALSELED